MRLIDEWRVQLNRVWSIRWAIVGAILASADQILQAFVGTIPPVIYAIVFVLIIVFRLIAQNATAESSGTPSP